MCGRYAASRSPDDLVVEFEAVRAEGQTPLPADYNVAPTKDVYVVRHKKERDAEGAPTGGGHRELRAVRWGLVPSWAKDVSVGNRMLNARVESLTDKPAFRRRRARGAAWCRPTAGTSGPSGWTRPTKQPYFVTAGGRLGARLRRALGGLGARRGPALHLHGRDGARGRCAHRDPRPRCRWCCRRDRWADWLDPAREDVEALAEPTPPEVVEALELRPVSTAVNNVANNGPELTARAESVSEPADQPALF